MRRLPFAVCETIDVGSIKLSFQFCVGGWINQVEKSHETRIQGH